MWFDSLGMAGARRSPHDPATEDRPPLPHIEDMPWCGTAYVVSKRFRKFLEKEAAGHT